MKKILVIHNRYRERGGEDIAVMHEISTLKKNYEVEYLIFDNNIESFFMQLIYFTINKNLRSNKLIQKKIDDFNPDLIYIHNTWFKISNGIFKLLKKTSCKVIVKFHNFRYECTKSFFSYNHLQKQDFCRACGLSKNELGLFNKYFKDSYLKSLLVNYYGIKYYKSIKKSKINIFVLTNFQKNLLDKSFLFNKIIVNPNIIQNNFVKSENKKMEKFIIYAGRVSKEKGVEDLIKSFLNSDLKDFKLKIVGTGPQLINLKAKYSNRNIDFLGEIPNKKVIELIKKSSAVITATKLFEGQPTLLCEASLNKIPSIFPKTGGISEFFYQNYPLSFEQFNYIELIEKINLLNNEQFNQEVGMKCYEYLKEYLNEELYFKRINEIIDEK